MVNIRGTYTIMRRIAKPLLNTSISWRTLSETTLIFPIPGGVNELLRPAKKAAGTKMVRTLEKSSATRKQSAIHGWRTQELTLTDSVELCGD